MAKRQTRRSISVMGRTYARLDHHTKTTGESVSGYIERLVAADLDARGVPVFDKLPPVKPREPNMDDVGSGIFTF